MASTLALFATSLGWPLVLGWSLALMFGLLCLWLWLRARGDEPATRGARTEPVEAPSASPSGRPSGLGELLRLSTPGVRAELFHAMIEQSQDGFSIADMEGNYLYVNRAFAQMVGYGEDELLRMKVFDLRGSSQPPGAFDSVKRDRPREPLLVHLRRKDGSEFLSEIAGTIVDFGGGSCVLGIVRDVTERERANQERLSLERQVQHGQKLESLGVLAGGIAHDFNNLLTAILGNAGLARLGLPEGSESQRSLEAIERAAETASVLTRQMLDYSGKGRFVIEAVELPDLVRGITRLLSVSIPKKIAFEAIFAEDTPPVEGDSGQLRQVVMNLITNAAEAIGDGVGNITLETGCVFCDRDHLDRWTANVGGVAEPLPEGDYAFVEVRDDGCGMDEETRARIFDPFFTTKFAGRGLGMSAVLGILRGHRGTIEVDSAPGQGTRLRLLLPAAEAAATDGPGTPPSGSNLPVPTKGRVLVVDDEESVRLVGVRMLKHLGYRVDTACDGAEAVRRYREGGDFLCVLLDLTMPELDGGEAMKAILELDPCAKIILCSGYSERDAAERAGCSPDAFLQKPYSLEHLRAALRRAISPR